ncbi:MAG TPA: NAD(P)H-binding protein [Candidatus Acidoferrum sp.]|nr:NAD(P)H-binding protein [Candidatus Acidoferrum sp.]
MKILLFGATGSAGAAVLEACLAASIVEEVRAIVRRPLMDTSPKLRTFVHKDFLDYATVEDAFRSVDACFFCLGISATQVSQEEYRTITYSYTLTAANMFKAKSPGAAFHYISGRGTKAGSRMFWAGVKAQTEHDLIDLVDANCWRPAFIGAKPSPSLPKVYSLIQPLARLLKPFPDLYVHGHDIGRAMLQATSERLRSRIIENAEIRQIAARANF